MNFYYSKNLHMGAVRTHKGSASKLKTPYQTNGLRGPAYLGLSCLVFQKQFVVEPMRKHQTARYTRGCN